MPAWTPLSYRWTWELRASPAALWPLVSNTDRFNRDCGYPPVETVASPAGPAAAASRARRLRARVAGLVIEWDEHAFEWLEPVRFAVERAYFSGPVARMVVRCELKPRSDGGTSLTYEMELTPSGLFGRLALPFAIGRRARALTAEAFRRYDEAAARGTRTPPVVRGPRLTTGSTERLRTLGAQLARSQPALAQPVEALSHFLATADDLSAARIRPYALAAHWSTPRRQALELCLHATRAGLLDLSWELVCPHCRGARAARPTLTQIETQAHCDSCQIDFTANFDQNLELTFTPNPVIRQVPRLDYCIGGPQVTPHIVAQKRVAPSASARLQIALPAGRYRVRSPGIAEQQAFRLTDTTAPREIRIELTAKPLVEPTLAPGGDLALVNASSEPRLAIVERLAWSDDSATAAEVTALQVFRDLFSHEVLRRGEKISVGAITVVFTDLKNSTQLYRDIGDAPAFGRVLTHFDLLRSAIADEGGAIVKTMGDAVMAVFIHPVAALRAMTRAQRWLAHPQEFAPTGPASAAFSAPEPLALKVSINCGPCLAINQNDRLDYFGSTVNFAARLCPLSTGADVIVSPAVHADPEVTALLATPAAGLSATPDRATLKGFGGDTFKLWRISRG